MIGASVLLKSGIVTPPPFSITGAVTNYAGAGGLGTVVNGTTLLNSNFNGPIGMWFDASDNLYICDYNGNALRKISNATQTITTFAGGNTVGAYVNGIGTAAKFDHPVGIVGISNVLYIVDSFTSVIRTSTTDKPLSGTINVKAGDSVNYTSGYVEGTGSTAKFNFPTLMTQYNSALYVADAKNNAIRKVTTAGVVSTHAGTSIAGYKNDTTATNATFSEPNGIAVDTNGNFYVSDTNNHTIRKIASNGTVTTFAGAVASNGSGTSGSTDGTGTAARFKTPWGIVYNPVDGNLYVCDTGNHTIRQITLAGVVTTIAGSAGTTGTTNGTGTAARFNGPKGIAVHSNGSLYVADTGNNKIRKIT